MRYSHIKKIRNFFNYIALFALSSTVLLPILFMLFGSFKEQGEVTAYPPRLLPVSFTYLGNFSAAWKRAPFGLYLTNSLIVGIFTLLGVLLICICAAYAFSHIKPWGAKYIFMLFMSGMMIPPQVTVVPRYMLMQKMGLIDTHAAMIIPFLADPMGIFLLYQFFRTVPKDLEEAARLDGCGPFRFLVSILIPLARPSIGALSILTFVNSWNRYMWPLIVTNTTKMRTAPIGIKMFLDETEGSHLGVMMAGAVIVIAPAILVFIIGQKQFVKALASGAVKG